MATIRNVLILTFGSVASQITALVLGILLARTFSAADYGSYQQLLLVSTLSTLLFSVALPASLLYFVPNLEGEKRAAFLWRTAGLLAVAGGVAAGCLVLARFALAQAFHNPDLASLAPWFAPSVMATVGTSFFLSAAIALGRSRLAAGFTLTASTANFLLIGGAAWLSPRLEALIAAWSAAGLLMWAVSLVLLAMLVGRPRLRGGSIPLPEQLRYALPLGLTSIVGTLSWQMDKLLVGTGVDPGAYAVYVVGATEIPFIAALSGAVNNVLTPEFAKLHRQGDTPGILKRWHAAMGGLSLVYFPLFAYLMLEAGTLIPLVFSPRYADSVPLFQIYLLLMPLRIATYGLIFQATGRTHLNLAGSVMYLIANLLFTGLGLHVWGLPGAAAGSVLATLALIGYYLILLRRELAVSLGALVPWRLLLGNAVPAGLALAVTWAGTRAWPSLGGLAEIMVSLALFGTTYLLLASALGRLRLADVPRILNLGPERSS
jgi:O-antigen/teichoic acid export membrane protein